MLDQCERERKRESTIVQFTTVKYTIVKKVLYLKPLVLIKHDYATRALNLIVIKTGVIKTALHDQHCFKVTHFKHLIHQNY
jgi:hypothetical protein